MNLPHTFESVVIPDLNAFLVCLSHLPTELQLSVLEQATQQLTQVIKGKATT